MSHVELVQDIYEKFTRGDAQSILATFAPDVEFRLAEGHPSQPSGQPWCGTDTIAQPFFTTAGAEWDGWSIALTNEHAMGDTVGVEGRYPGGSKPTGKALNAQAGHMWQCRNGLVKRRHQDSDTAQWQAVLAPR